ncbi:MAG: Nif3-like dinuclear metal center hexameric protein [Proteobacteria bacterium]|nr:Nif3-like dinuclear metal center hexameric protein [Pseudomonadota bacterium]
MPVHLREVVGYLDTTLESGRVKDYCPNGLQVEGAPEVSTVVCGVSASAELITRAIEAAADLIVVHHGLVWGHGITKIAGPLGQRLKLLLAHDVSLAAYHLPLDLHARLGNNTGLADAIALGPTREAFGDVRGTALGLSGRWAQPLTRAEAIARIAGGVCNGASPRFVFPYGPDVVRKVGLCTGAASDLLEAAAAAGCDLFLTGELAERSAELAKELQITLVAAGHYQTEVFGPMRVAEELRMKFPTLAVQFIGVPNPL